MKIKKQTIIRLIKTIVFLAGCVGFTILFSIMLMPKNNARGEGILNPNARGFHGEPEDSIDIFMLGNSDGYGGFSPMELWNGYGYTSYIAAEGSSSVGQVYNMLKEILECQSPKLVILETDCFWNGTDRVGRVEKNITATWERLIPLLRYHDRWKWVKPEQYFGNVKYSYVTVTKGQLINRDTVPYTGGDYMSRNTGSEPIPRSAVPYIDAILDLCEENDMQVLFVTIPSANSWNQAKHDAMTEYASDRGVPYIDMNVSENDIGLDWSVDTRDGGNHLNCNGAKKVTDYLAEYISTNYSLEDHRQDANYQAWNDNYIKYENYIKK